jgi:PAS domain-containing protein
MSEKAINVLLIEDNPGDARLIRLAEEALKKAHDELERRVDERTAQLVRANEKLKQEVEERGRAEGALLKSRDYLDRIINGMYEGLVGIDRNLIIKDVNDRFLKDYKSVREDIIGRTCYEISHKVNEPCYDCMAWQG